MPHRIAYILILIVWIGSGIEVNGQAIQADSIGHDEASKGYRADPNLDPATETAVSGARDPNLLLHSDRLSWLPQNGSIEIGSVYGSIPFTLATSSPWNFYAKGTIALDVAKIPIGLEFDLGTDLPVRGRRNSIRMSFDAPQLLDVQRFQQTASLHKAEVHLDSLETEVSKVRRNIFGSQARVDALERQINMPTSNLDSLHIQKLSLEGTDSLAPPLGGPFQTDSPRSTVDSLKRHLADLKVKMEHLERVVAEHRNTTARLRAQVPSAVGKEKLITQFARGIKKLEVGSCSPTSSEFLINGINLQGVSFEFSHQDLFLSVDRGRSFDDSWLITDPVARDLRQLHQSLFLTDARDLNPRRLTAIRSGFGKPGDTHVHFGYLHGRREDLPLGIISPGTSGPEVTNHVLELDVAVEIWKKNTLKVVYARSLILSGNAVEGELNDRSMADLLSPAGDKDEAFKVGLSSELPRSRTTVELEARTIDPYFQSFGLGFIRNGSRSGEVHVDQHIGNKIRIRTRGIIEERSQGVQDLQNKLILYRGQAMLMYKATSFLGFRGMALPTRVLTIANAQTISEHVNMAYGLGADLRKRWKKKILHLTMDVTTYEFVGATGGQMVSSHTIAAGFDDSNGLGINCSWSSMKDHSADSIPLTSNVSVQLRYLHRNGIGIGGGLQIPNTGRVGWCMNGSYPLNERFILHLRGQQFSTIGNFFVDDLEYEQTTAYNWALGIQYKW